MTVQPTNPSLDERAAIVALIRAEERMIRIRRPKLCSDDIAAANVLANVADAIERGDHLFVDLHRIRLGEVKDGK